MVDAHEQLHVANLLEGAEKWAKDIEATEKDLAAFGTSKGERCEYWKEQYEVIGTNALSNWAKREAAHEHPSKKPAAGDLSHFVYGRVLMPVAPDCTKP